MALKKVLVIDDEPDFVTTICDRLQFDGYMALSATSAEEAFGIACKERPDLILLDIMMPGMDGIRLFKKFRSESKLASTPVIFVSVRGDVMNDPVISVDKHCHLLRKPFDMNALMHIIGECLAEV